MRHTLNINGKTVSASPGDNLIDAALMGKILIPHDCATGQCETCRVRIPWGEVDAAGTQYGDTVLACQARVVGDATITFETAPPVETVAGKIETLLPLSNEVVEVAVRTKAPLAHRPGQYAKLALNGYPAREYSFSAKMSGETDPDLAVFQIKRFDRGRVSPAIGNAIRVGHKARVTGPFGSAYLREQESGPIVLTASGTGFAPIWSLARAVTIAHQKRPLSIVTGVRSPNEVYMQEAFDWLRENGQKNITISAREGADCARNGTIMPGRPDDYLPDLCSQTSVHVAGNPSLVERVKQRALEANAHCHADPFTPSSEQLGWRERFRPIAALSGLFPRAHS